MVYKYEREKKKSYGFKNLVKMVGVKQIQNPLT